MATATGTRSMELEGTLGAFQLPDVLRFLAMGHMTGRLTLSNETRVVDLEIVEGRLIGSLAPDRHLRLGQLLVYGGLLGRKELEDSLDQQRTERGARMLGEMLIERKLSDAETITRLLQLQVEEELWDLLSWPDGSFKFEHGVTRTMQRALINLEIEPLLEAGALKLEEWQQIARTLARPHEVFRVRPDLAVVPEVKLTPGGWRVLSLINGQFPMEVLVYLSGLGKFETLRALDRLMSLQLIEPVEPQAASPTPGGGRRGGPQDVGPIRGLEPAAATEPSRKGGLFARWRGGDGQGLTAGEVPTTPSAPAGPFASALALGCELLNRLVHRFWSELGCGSPEQLCRQLWTAAGMRFPRADLLAIEPEGFSAASFERYRSMSGASSRGMQGCLVGCYEDGMAALAAMGQELAKRVRQKLGARGETALTEHARPFLEGGVEVAWPHDFMPRAWIRQWMGTAGE